MTKFLLIALLLTIPFAFATAQVYDDFSDNNFTQNPTWSGDDSLFQITSRQLRLKGTITSEAALVTPHTLTDSITWTFYSRFTLSPSTQNFSRFYLMSSSSNLKSALNGYYVQLGGVTGNTDSITLYKQSGTTHTRIIGGRAGTVSKTTNTVGIKVFRNHLGNWELYSDTSGGKNYILEGTGFDDSFTTSAYLGWYIKYSAGNNQGHYLDDVFANKIGRDTTAPKIDSVVLASANTLLIYFNEPIDATTGTNTDNYLLAPQNRNPISASFVNDNTLLLTFNVGFEPNVLHTITVTDMLDLAGNSLLNQTATFTYQVVLLNDILISEFFADPTPVIGLPELEFIELYNNSGVPQNLNGFQLTDGGTANALPNITLQPDSFLIVCATSSLAAFQPFGNTVGVSNFPSLNNTGDQLILKSNKGDTIHALTYDLTWYNDKSKTDGGWSIELINPKEMCKGALNYAASTHPAGGTPGQVNAVWRNSIDTTKPKLVTVFATDSVTLLLVFDKKLDLAAAAIAKVTVNGGLASLVLQGNDTLVAKLSTAMQNKNTYVILVDSITDCLGNLGKGTYSLYYTIAEEAANYDVLITEIMADPDPVVGLVNAEYLELHNRSTKIIDLKNWRISDATSSVTLPSFILLPDSFVVITSGVNAGSFAGATIGLSSFLSLANDGEPLTIYNNKGQVIHQITYTSAWYTDAIKRNGGWSIEMIDTKNPCALTNWKASINQLGGTPAKQNSVKNINPDKTVPTLIRVYAQDSMHLLLEFSEAMDSTSFINSNKYQFTPANSVAAVSGNAPSYQSTMLQLTTKIAIGDVYAIMVADVKDCAGNNLADEYSTSFALPEKADSGQLIINELLFNPISSGVDFVELYNNSNKAIELNGLAIAHTDANQNIDDIKPITSQGFTLMPNNYVVLTSSPDLIKQQYHCQNPNAFIKLDLTSLPDDEGNIALTTTQGTILDQLFYTKNMHLSVLSDENGVSLERVDPNRASTDFTNWTSAATSVGYATPTYKNSQYLLTERSDNVLQLQPKTVSPDGDGYQDLMNVNYQLNEDGFVGALTIYDAAGRVVKHLFKNHIMGKVGTYTWDGTLNDGSKAPIGIYVFYLEVFNTAGVNKQYKTVGVVAGKL